MGLLDFLKKKEPSKKPIENEHEKIIFAVHILKNGYKIKAAFDTIKRHYGLTNEQTASILEAATNLKDSPGYDSDLTAAPRHKDNVLFALNELIGKTPHDEIIEKLQPYNNLTPEQAEDALEKAISLYDKFFAAEESKNESGTISSMTPKTEKEKPLSINERFAQQKNTSLNDRYANTNNDATSSPKNPIEIQSVGNRYHGDNFAALLGYNNMQNSLSENIINPIVANALISTPIHENPIYKICQSDFYNIGGNSKRIKLRLIYVITSAAGKDFILDVFPYLETNRTIPFKVKRIDEWQEYTKLEAEIEGGGRDTFGLGFFATDYAYNKNKYKESQSLDVKISALALVIDRSDATEINGTPLSPDFATYLPNKDFPGKSYNDFIGVLLNHEKVSLTNELTGYILTIKLINHEEEDFFTIDVFANEQNMRIKEIHNGMKLTGCLSFQGEIA